MTDHSPRATRAIRSTDSRRPSQAAQAGQTAPDLGTGAWVLTVDETAKLLRISRGLAFAAVRAGAIPHVRLGRRILIPAHRLRDLLGDAPTDVAALGTARTDRPAPTSGSSSLGGEASLRELADTLEALVQQRRTQQQSGRSST